MNPETLREWANGEDCPVGSEWFIRAAADAWEADRQRYDTLEADHNVMCQHLHEEIDILLQRLEVARGIAEAALKRWKSRPWETTDNAERHMKDILAALAAGDTISDGFGNTWSATCECGGKMSVVRPGVVQCSECG